MSTPPILRITGTVRISIRWPAADDPEWTDYALLTKDELLDLGLILNQMKTSGRIGAFSLVHVHANALGLAETLARLPKELQPHIPPPLP